MHKTGRCVLKRVGNIYGDVCDLGNIKAAILNASKGKKHRSSVKAALDDIDNTAGEIQRLLVDKSYKPSKAHEFERFDGARQKMRTITCPSFYPDQIIHWCLMQILQPVFMRGMYAHSYGSIPGRGSISAKRYVEKALRRKPAGNTKYTLQLDIKKFYKNIDRDILKRMLRRKIKDRDTLWLCDTIIDGYQGDGVPIGFFTSQWFANFYLEGLDHYIKEILGVGDYIRYMDDLLLFGSNKRRLRKVKLRIEEYLASIGLNIKESWKLFKTVSRPVDFLGFKICRTHTTLRRSTFLRFRRRVAKVAKKRKPSALDAHAIISYLGLLTHTDSHKIMTVYVLPNIDIGNLKEVIRHESRVYAKAA